MSAPNKIKHLDKPVPAVARLDLSTWRDVPLCPVCGRWDFPRGAWQHANCPGHKAYVPGLPLLPWLDRDDIARERVQAAHGAI